MNKMINIFTKIKTQNISDYFLVLLLKLGGQSIFREQRGTNGTATSTKSWERSFVNSGAPSEKTYHDWLIDMT